MAKYVNKKNENTIHRTGILLLVFIVSQVFLMRVKEILTPIRMSSINKYDTLKTSYEARLLRLLTLHSTS